MIKYDSITYQYKNSSKTIFFFNLECLTLKPVTVDSQECIVHSSTYDLVRLFSENFSDKLQQQPTFA